MRPGLPGCDPMYQALSYTEPAGQRGHVKPRMAIIRSVVGPNKENIGLRELGLRSGASLEINPSAINSIPKVILGRSGAQMPRIKTLPVIASVQYANSLKWQCQSFSDGVCHNMNGGWLVGDIHLPVPFTCQSVWPLKAGVTFMGGDGIQKKLISCNWHRLSPPMTRGAVGRGSRKVTALQYFTKSANQQDSKMEN